ncbi:serine/threonine protein kinase [Pyxidicoccus sp. MSG2]|uniref:serine/threonine protein kinase n=1 Tax=Pyxidicoccus sp. MSG2 TaxID=2996790 RepID=UPI00226EB976|nr:serine/threonine-protein kinase [Pyxidicoccus sp. MSG2]MCY1018303.1 serine/threonine-protein kinase [Pyxidicoccus sp. MSG2]
MAHPLTLRPGMTVGPWRILAPLGSGSFGIVFQVEHAGQRHALKFALRGPGSDDLNHTDARAAKELACLLQAVHPNVARVWAHGRWPDSRTGYHYVVMDFVDGSTLDGWVKRARPSARRVARLFARLARALGELHARDVFHRDLKPSNILVRADDDEPVLVDFGSADHAEAPPLTEGTLPPGTTRYRSPEALRFHREHHDRPDARYPFRATDDLYALGVTLHEVLTGAPAFSPTLPREVLIEHIEERLPPLPSGVNPRVPAALEAITLRLLRKRARERFPHGEALHAAFEEALRSAGPEWDKPLFPGAAPPPTTPARNDATGSSSGPHPEAPSAGKASAPASGPHPAPDAHAAARRPASWHLLGAGVLLGLLAMLGWKSAGAPHASEQLLAPTPTAHPGASHSAAEQPTTTMDAGMEEGLLEPSPTTREEPVTNPTTPGTPKPSAPGALKRALPRCLAGVAAAASLHCASTTYATPVGERPRRNQPCSTDAMRSMDEVLRGFRGPYRLPLIATAQLDFHQDYADGDVLIGGLRTGSISSIVRNPGAFPSNTVLHGWVWVNGEDAEIQWFEADIPRHGKESATRITICARVGNPQRRTVRHAPGSTPKDPIWVRTDEYVVVDRW